jgi:hypothetical protein
MNLRSIIRALSVPRALTRYNRKYHSKCGLAELALLYIIHRHQFPINKHRMKTLLAKLHRTASYIQLTKRIDYLITKGFIMKDQRKNKYSITPFGVEFLNDIERISKTARIDKIKY